ncbi:retinoblastoma-related protein-like isoform X1 [Malus domestica]|uniref:retinoblastoma-related protein-like isoform X1 n=1 Tax=Malus domestica TaxID=3750 RepID=UPI0007EE115A
MVKMEDAKPEVSASNNSNSESCDSGLLQDRFTYLCKMVFVIGRELLQASCKYVQRNQDLLISNASAIGNGTALEMAVLNLSCVTQKMGQGNIVISFPYK